MSEKLHNEEFDVKRVDGSALSGDSNKIKLKITSYAVILEVQEAYMKEEIAAKEQDKKDLEQKLESEELSRKDKREIKKDLSLLNAELDILNDVFLEFSESRKRFMEIAKKALKLPEENLKELGETGWLEMESKKVNIDTEYENIQNKLIDAQDDENVFTSVDTDAIKEAVEKAMNEKSEDLPEGYKNDGDFIAENITSDNFDDAISSATENIKDVVDEKKTDELTEEDARDIFANAGTVASENPKIKEEENATPDFSLFGQEEIIPETHTIEFENPPIAAETSEWAAEPATEVEENATPDFSLFGQEEIIPETHTIEFENPPIAVETSEWAAEPATEVEENTNTNNSISFDGDTSIEEMLANLEKQNEALQNKWAEMNQSVFDTKAEQENANKRKNATKEELDEARRKSEETKEQIRIFKMYKPQMESLKKANAEQERLNKAKEEELKTETANLASINLDIEGMENEIAMYNSETSKDLEELKKLRAEFTGTDYDSGDTPIGGEGGRKK